jgi:hypothetical protein
MFKVSYIKRLPNGKWRVLSESGKNLGTYDTRPKAVKRLKQVEMFKHIKNKKRKKSFEDFYKMISNASETTTTYSAVMRDLNKEAPDKVVEFMKTFKEAFDNALVEELEDPEGIALIQAMKEVKYSQEKEAAEAERMIKMAQTVVEMGDPSLSGKSIANVIKFLVRKMPLASQTTSLQTLRSRVMSLNEYEISTKKTPPSASYGQAIAFIKNMLGGHNPEYIRRVLQIAVKNMY